MSKAVFLDRDGVINDNATHVNKPEDLKLYPEACGAIKLLNDAGYQVFVVTNQGGVGCGFMTEDTLKRVHDKLEADLAQCGAQLTEIAACTHHPKVGCECRKPKPGMITTLAEKHGIDLVGSWLVGDMETDCQAGKAGGVGRTILLGDLSEWADFTASNLAEAVAIILGGGADDRPTSP